MKTLFISNIAPRATETDITELFSTYGTVRKLKMPRDLFSGRCRGFALIDMEGHEARAAAAALNGKSFMDSELRIRDERPKQKRRGPRR